MAVGQEASKSRHSAPIVVGNFDASKPWIVSIPDLPPTRPFQKSSPLPSADTTPTPVTTIRSPAAAAPGPNMRTLLLPRGAAGPARWAGR